MKRIVAILLGALCSICCFACSKVKEPVTYEITYSLVVNGETIGELPDALKKPNGVYPSEYVAGDGDAQNAEIIQQVDGLVESCEYSSFGEIIFQGWYLDEACTQPFKGISNITVGDIKLYGIYYAKGVKTVTYYAVIKGEKKDLSALPEKMRNGVSLPETCSEWSDLEVGDLKGYLGETVEYKFEGWYMDENCEQAFDVSKIEGDDLTLYAKISYEVWTKFY